MRKFLNELLIEEDYPSLPSPSFRSIPTREEKRRGCQVQFLLDWDAAIEEDEKRNEEIFLFLQETVRSMTNRRGTPVYVVKEKIGDHVYTVSSFFSKEEAEEVLLKFQEAEKSVSWSRAYYFIEKLMVK